MMVLLALGVAGWRGPRPWEESWRKKGRKEKNKRPHAIRVIRRLLPHCWNKKDKNKFPIPPPIFRNDDDDEKTPLMMNAKLKRRYNFGPNKSQTNDFPELQNQITQSKLRWLNTKRTGKRTNRKNTKAYRDQGRSSLTKYNIHHHLRHPQTPSRLASTNSKKTENYEPNLNIQIPPNHRNERKIQSVQWRKATETQKKTGPTNTATTIKNNWCSAIDDPR